MARLYIPEPKIDLYKDGFDKHDKLGRKATGDKLSDLVERIDDPLVIALDGAWGSGKSVFLKCWVGEHLKREGNTTQTVYFDAFQHDYLDDPLIALTSAISERIERDPESKSAKAWRMAKNAAPFLGKAALRLSTAALIGKAISLTGEEDGELNDIGDKLAEEGGEIAKSLNDFWKKEDGKRAAMDAFREALVQLTAPDEHGVPTKKLVIVIDELDRCRPDYALSKLEIIKHFFNVDGVHFVLGVNLKELANSVKARYGAEIAAEHYLQKFITIQTTIGRHRDLVVEDNTTTVLNLFKDFAIELDAKNHFLYGSVLSYIKNKQFEADFSLRAMRRMLSAMVLTCPPVDPNYNALDHSILAGLLLLQAFDPPAIQQIRNLQGKFHEITSCLSFVEPDLADKQDLLNMKAWSACYSSDVPQLLEEVWGNTYREDGGLQHCFDRNRVKFLLETCIDVFEISV